MIGKRDMFDWIMVIDDGTLKIRTLEVDKRFSTITV